MSKMNWDKVNRQNLMRNNRYNYDGVKRSGRTYLVDNFATEKQLAYIDHLLDVCKDEKIDVSALFVDKKSKEGAKSTINGLQRILEKHGYWERKKKQEFLDYMERTRA